jgi:hypothetical protein
MASTVEVSTEQRDTSVEQPEESLLDQQMVASMEVALEQGADFDRGSQSSDSETASDNCERMKIGGATALASISYDFGLSTIRKTRIGSLESFARYFPKGYGRPLGAESISDPRENEVVVFEDFFTARLRMPPHLVLVNILCEFWV